MKRIRMAAIILAAAIFSFAFAGCSADSNNEKSSTKGAFLTFCINAIAGNSTQSPVGTWKVTGGEMYGQSLSAEQLSNLSGSDMTLNTDGTITAGGKTIGSWSLNGNTLTLVDGETSLDCEYTGTNIYIDMNSLKVIYSRV
ncbi:MAG: hypothetical protein MSR67_02200 [Oscillospiraceae bacterium]|nr:hypothetical protein [Oscillospiraceae bacterium]